MMIIHLPFFVVFPMLDPEVPPSPILLLVPCSHSHLRELQIDWDWPPSSLKNAQLEFSRETDQFITQQNNSRPDFYLIKIIKSKGSQDLTGCVLPWRLF